MAIYPPPPPTGWDLVRLRMYQVLGLLFVLVFFAILLAAGVILWRYAISAPVASNNYASPVPLATSLSTSATATPTDIPAQLPTTTQATSGLMTEAEWVTGIQPSDGCPMSANEAASDMGSHWYETSYNRNLNVVTAKFSPTMAGGKAKNTGSIAHGVNPSAGQDAVALATIPGMVLPLQPGEVTRLRPGASLILVCKVQ